MRGHIREYSFTVLTSESAALVEARVCETLYAHVGENIENSPSTIKSTQLRHILFIEKYEI